MSGVGVCQSRNLILPINEELNTNLESSVDSMSNFANQTDQLENRNKHELVIMDVDTGIDDARALFLMLAAEKSSKYNVKLIAITCVNGNTILENALINTTRVMNVSNNKKTPIYRGADSPLIRSKWFHEDPPYFGKDGFGDAGFSHVKPRIQKQDAVSLIISSLKKHGKGKVTLLAIAPLTNLAIAVSKNPEISDYPKRIIILGGNIKGIGNSTATGEFNFLTDPEAARIVLEQYTCPIVIVPWETILDSALPYEFRQDVLGNINTPEEKLLDKAEAKLLEKDMTSWLAIDATAAAYLLNPAVAAKTEKYFCTVELQGEFTRGQMVVDRIGYYKKQPNATIVTEVNKEILKKFLIFGVGGKAL